MSRSYPGTGASTHRVPYPQGVARPQRNPRCLRVALAAIALACLAAPQAAQGKSAQEIRDYWTPERMENAIPGDELLAGVGPVDDTLGTLGLGGSSSERQATRVSNPRAPGKRTHGKVFFTLGVLDYVCSGTSVKAKTRSLVVTAGHCIYSESDGYARNFEFVPAYENGNAPFGEWPAPRSQLKATEQWEDNESIRYDVGMATVSRTNGSKLARVVGARGIAFNRGRDLTFRVFGYPAEDPYDGQSMYRCRSEAKGTDRQVNPPRPTRIRCDQTGGSSGGGWVISRGRVNSVVSYGYECSILLDPLCNNPEEGNLFGPYFGGEVKKLYRSQKR